MQVRFSRMNGFKCNRTNLNKKLNLSEMYSCENQVKIQLENFRVYVANRECKMPFSSIVALLRSTEIEV